MNYYSEGCQLTKQIDDGGTAFPYREQDCNGQYNDHFGMTLRDYFAAAALQGLLTQPAEAEFSQAENFAKASYQMADAMIEARKGGA